VEFFDQSDTTRLKKFFFRR